ncbi:toll-like receptor 9 [Chiloscyllium plagiosum]|uniref:toll-like receptor 9 n=1 Tax=Chiloscyllium plagiosum TaxID=36176 RepID=UPI001CB7D430|nr:toll-like receptor 9 [Chiloscyllium plagiosum]
MTDEVAFAKDTDKMDICKNRLRELLLVLLNCIVTHCRFPSFLPCDGLWLSRLINCSHRGLISIPIIRSENATTLLLNFNSLQEIKKESFSGVPNLEILDLSYNCCPGKLRSPGEKCKLTIEPTAFLHLRKLKKIDLTGNSLTRIPPLPANLIDLRLILNNIINLQFSNVSNLVNLEVLNISKNCYYQNPCNTSMTIAENTFKRMHRLHILEMDFNNMKAVPRGLPRSLTRLSLCENKIQRISAEDFKGLVDLEQLLLAWNCQRCDHASQPCFPCKGNKPIELSPGAFHPLRKLKQLVLRGNSLRKLDAQLFHSLGGLTELDLSDNFLAYEIQNATFFANLHMLQDLNLMYNYEPYKTFDRLVLPPSFVNLTSLRKFQIDGYFFSKLDQRGIHSLLRLPNLKSVNFRMNFIKTVDLKLFENITTLKYIGLSENKVSFSRRTSKWYGDENNRIEEDSTSYQERQISERRSEGENNEHANTKDRFSFQRCSSYAKTFDLSSNNIADIKAEDFEGLEDVECLLLSSNYLTQTLNGSQFNKLKKLKHLDITHNRIDFYHGKAFSEIPLLETLDLSYNSYTFEMKGMGHNFSFINMLPSLRYLSLAHNQIAQRVSTELHSNSLNALDFKGNMLSLMWESGTNTYLSFFYNLHNLTFLDISENKLMTVPPDAMVRFPSSLKELYINKNQINFFNWDNLTVLVNLQLLDLSNNLLNGLPKTPCHFPKTFSKLVLHHNLIMELPSAFFSKVKAMRYLDLSHNRIKILNENSFPSQLLGGLEVLALANNPFSCTCDADWFIHFIEDTNVSLPELTTSWKCEFPESQQGMSILSTNPLSCQKVYGSISFVLSFLLTVTFTVLPILNKLFGWDFWYAFHVCAAKLKGSATIDQENLHYDAFIVFDTTCKVVADWVYDELVVNLEKKGLHSFRLCLEERDWIPGKSSIENLYDAIYQSRKTIFILTNPYFVSGQLRQAFFIAHQRLLDEKVDVIVLVLLDQSLRKSRYLQLRKRLCKASVLRWPHNPYAEPYFWLKFQKVLTRDNRLQYDPNFSESFLPFEYNLQSILWHNH